jgi:DNA-binding transcriptional LysR family regulator
MTPLEDLVLLRAFVCIVESGSISAAARRLKVPQPSLSRRLRMLEDNCGVVLLRRDTHRMSLTEAGHRLLEDAQAMLMLADEAAQRLHEDQAVLRGHLRLFVTIDSGQFATTRLIARFLQANPGVTAELSYTNRPLQMIQEGYDAGVIVGSITDESVIARPAFKVVRYLVAAPDLIEKASRGERAHESEIVALDCSCGRTIWWIGRGDTLGAEARGADAPHCAGADFGRSHESARGSAGGRRRGGVAGLASAGRPRRGTTRPGAAAMERAGVIGQRHLPGATQAAGSRARLRGLCGDPLDDRDACD